MIENFANLVIRYRYIMIILSLILVGAGFKGFRNLMVFPEDGSRPYINLANDYRIFFKEDNEQLLAFEDLQGTYTKNDNVLFVLAPKDGNVFTKKTFAAIEELTELAWKTPYSLRVDSLTNYQHTYGEDDDLIVEPLASDASLLTENDLARIKNIALNEPLLVHRLTSEKGHTTGVNITVQMPGKNKKEELEDVADYARELEKTIESKYPEIDVYLTGIVMMNKAFPEASQADMRTLYPLMLLVIVVTLYLLVRSAAGTFTTLLIIFMSMGFAMGVAGWMQLKMSPPAMVAPIVIMTLAVADCVHILVSYFHAMHEGMEKRAAMVESLRLNFQPVFLTSLTTAIGFLTMNFSDAPPFHDLGNIVAVGVMMAFLLSVVFLPALMMIFPAKARKQDESDNQAMKAIAEFVISQRNKLMIVVGAIILALFAMVPKNEINDEFVKYFDESIQFRSDTDFVMDNLTGIYMIEYSVDSKGSQAITDPEYLENLEKVANWFRSQPEVVHVNTLTDIMKRLNKNLHSDDDTYYRIPQSRELAAQYLLLYEMSLPFGLDLNNQINVDKSSTRLTVTLEEVSSNELLDLQARADDWMKGNLPAYMHAEAASPSVMFAHIGYKNARSMLSGTVVALALISFILMFALRSFKIGLLSLIPNMAPAGMAFGVWALINGQVGMSLALVASMTLGIVVDDTVHFLSKYLRARREKNLSSQEAVRYAFASVGKALWVTSAVLVAGFLILSMSAFELNAGMGLLTAITIAIALFADFFFLPPILMKVEDK